MNKKKIIEWLKLNRNKIISIIFVILVLVTAFWYGGNSKESHGFKVNKTSEKISYEENLEKSTDDMNMLKDTTTEGESENTTTVIPEENSSEQNEQNNNDTGNISSEQIDNPHQIEPEIGQENNDSENGNSDRTENQTTTQKKNTCTISISCATILNNMDSLDKDKKSLVPSDGWILKEQTVVFNEGDSIFDVLQKVCMDNKIHMESSWTPLYNSAYIEGIYNLYEFDCGSLSGWMYNVDGEFFNSGSSKLKVQNGDNIRWVYTCNLGKDVK